MLSADDLPVREPARRPCPAAHGRAMVDLYCESYSKAPKRIVLDIDTRSTRFTAASNCACSTRTTTNTAFNPSSCSMARAVSSLLCCARPNAPRKEIKAFLRRLLRAIRANWPRVEILVRGDSHYCAPEVLDFCRANRSTISSASRRPRRCAGISRAWKPRRNAVRDHAREWQSPTFKEFYDGAASWSRVDA